MSEQVAHTPGELEVAANVEPNGTRYIEKVEGLAYDIAEVYGFGESPESQSKANAERLVACWNALEGLNPEAVARVIDCYKSMLKLIANGHGGSIRKWEVKVYQAALAALQPTTNTNTESK